MVGQAVDFEYLEGFAAGDAQVVSEVLRLFLGQAEAWRGKLADPDGWHDLVHTIKGAARGIGARALGDAAERAERGDASMAPDVAAALSDAVADIEGYLARHGG